MEETGNHPVENITPMPPEPLKTVGDAAPVESQIDTPEVEQPDITKMIAEAEERGYLRGINEQIEKRMSAPGLLEIPLPDSEKGENPRRCQILNAVRPCIWDI